MSRRLRSIDTPAVRWGALAALLIAGAAFLLFETRGTLFFLDEWDYILYRQGSSLATYLEPHNQHLSLVPVTIDKLLFSTFGIGSYTPYRVVAVACNLICAALLYLYAQRRMGAWAALVLVALLLGFGPGWEALLWPANINFVLSIACGIGALLALDRRSRGGDLGACALTALALATSGVGVPVAVGVAVELLASRRPWRDAWIVGVPLALYALWWIRYQQGAGTSLNALLGAPSYAATAAASVMSSLFGLAGPIGLDGPGTLVPWGTPLLIAAVAVLAWALWTGRGRSPRVLALLAILLSFWLAAAAARDTLGDPYSSRYIYTGAVFVLLLVAELMQGVRLRPLVAGGLLAAALVVLASNIGILRTEANMLRSTGQASAADLGALEIGRPVVPARYVLHELPGFPLVTLPAQRYLTSARTLGSPAASVATIESDPQNIRLLVDSELIAIHRIALTPAGTATVGAAGCERLAAPPFITPGSSPALTLTVPAAGLLIRSGDASATVGLRRFADQFQTLGTLAPNATARLRITPDRSSRPWQLQLSSTASLLACPV